ncbi:MAG: DUF2510 domain-containing protein [Actinomycetota bacterium]|nr:DUF2510 domain-containing protein [Actinomycetota bacterium]MDA3015320.1 DUF2510 domain-containing protein [Actinomycetota bacterium]MDA3027847.1 DUF2510 domain-containing protein [Actinomycetota bacterium]
MTSQPGWHPDPLGRFDHRFFDGSRWTADVAVDGVRRVDPLGIAPSHTRQPRRRRRIVMGVVVVAVVALAIPIGLLWSAVSKFARPVAHEATVTECVWIAGTVAVTAAVENQSTERASFTVFVEVTGPMLDRTVRSVTISIDRVAAGSTGTNSATFPSSIDEIRCRIVAVGGPLPFGVDVGPVGVQG